MKLKELISLRDGETSIIKEINTRESFYSDISVTFFVNKSQRRTWNVHKEGLKLWRKVTVTENLQMRNTVNSLINGHAN